MNFNGRYILDERGEPMPCEDLIEWATWFETAEGNRRVAGDQVGPYFISTIFLGLDYDHSLRPMADPLTYRPLLWETMVFKDGPVEVRRYRSREAALAGHKEFVDLIRLTELTVAENPPAKESDQDPLNRENTGSAIPERLAVVVSPPAEKQSGDEEAPEKISEWRHEDAPPEGSMRKEDG
jgi:hypothetical protein